MPDVSQPELLFSNEGSFDLDTPRLLTEGHIAHHVKQTAVTHIHTKFRRKRAPLLV